MGTEQQLLEQLNKLRGSRTVIVGIGNTLKGDDAAGPVICERLHHAGISAELIDAGIAPENYIQPIIKKAPQSLLVIDAIDFGVPPGTTKIFKPEQLNSVVLSTHVLSPRLFIDMIAKEIEVDVYFVGIQPEQLGLGQALSSPVSQAVQQLTSVLGEVFASEK